MPRKGKKCIGQSTARSKKSRVSGVETIQSESQASNAIEIDETRIEAPYFGMVTEEQIRQQAIMYEPSTSGLQKDVSNSVTSIEPEPEKNPGLRRRTHFDVDVDFDVRSQL